MAISEIPNDKRAFRCEHCNGTILIPLDLPSTTGPCPHCSSVITSPAPEIKEPPTRIVPPPAEKTIPPSPPTPPVQEIPTPVKVAATPPPPTIPAPREASETPVSTPAPAPKPDSATPAPALEKIASSKPSAVKPKPEKSGLIPVMLVLLVLILGVGVAAVFVSKELGNNIPPPTTVSIKNANPAAMDANYIRTGWQKEAYQLLRDYIAATSSEEKLPHVLNSATLATTIGDFYGGGVINDSDTPADAFSVYELTEEDRKRGLFMMVFNQPPQFDMKEFFRPLASLEVQYGIDEADLLLSTFARFGNFAMEPLRVHAFFKRTPEGLKLDWEIFSQTKYRTFQNFVDLPEAGQTAVFRVFIVEDVPDKTQLEAGTRTYRLTDPANITDTARINVKVDSETGRTLSIINWRGAKDSHPTTRTATVELSWIGDNQAPELAISRFICWEFLGLGGNDPSPTATTK